MAVPVVSVEVRSHKASEIESSCPALGVGLTLHASAHSLEVMVFSTIGTL